MCNSYRISIKISGHIFVPLDLPHAEFTTHNTKIVGFGLSVCVAYKCANIELRGDVFCRKSSLTTPLIGIDLSFEKESSIEELLQVWGVTAVSNYVQ